MNLLRVEKDITLQREEIKHNRKKNISGWLYALPYVLSFTIFIIVPLVWGFITSFMKYNPYDTSGNGFYTNLFYNYYVIIFKSGSNYYSQIFWKALGTTMLFDIVAVPCLIFVPLVLAYLVNLHPPGYKLFRAIIYLPSVLSVATMGAIFVLMFAQSDQGFINALLGTEIKWLEGINRWIVILIASVWWQSGQNFVIFSAALRDVDKSLFEASSIDGCGKFKQFIYITLPAIKNQMVICMFTTVIGYMSLYAQPNVIYSAINRNEIVSPIMLIQRTISNPDTYNLIGLMTATSFVFAFFLMILSAIQMYATREKKGGNKYAKKYQTYLRERS